MNKNLSRLKVFTILSILAVFAAACAPEELERLPVPGQEQPGGVESQSSGEAGPAADQSANIELPPTQPICPTPTPDVGVGITDGETDTGEAEAGPASPPEVVSGDSSTGAPDPDILDQVNQGPGVDRSGQTSDVTGVEPEPGTETQPGELPGSTDASGATEPTFGDLINSVIGQVLGTSEAGISFEPMPSPTPCP